MIDSGVIPTFREVQLMSLAIIYCLLGRWLMNHRPFVISVYGLLMEPLPETVDISGRIEH